MKLRSLSLQLFRQHVQSEVQFPDGLVGILGMNGSGKTTLVEAVGFALFGSRALRGKVEDVRTRTAPAKSGRGKRESELKVELSLEHEGVIFRIVRTLSDASLFVGGEAHPVAAGNRDVTARISAIVGMSYEEFIATYCTEQKGLEFLSGKKGAVEREKFIVRMMGYDRLEEVQELLRNDRKEKRAVLQGFEASLGSRDELQLRLEAEQGELEAIRAKHAEAAQTLQKADDDFKVLRDRMVKLEGLRTEYLKQKEAAQTFTVRYEERSKRLAALSDAHARAAADLARLLQPLAGDRSIDEVLARFRKQGAREKEALTGIVERARSLEVTWQSGWAEARAARDAIVQQVAQLKSKGARLGKLTAGAECPTCGQELAGSFEQVRQHFATEEHRLQQLLQAAEAQVGRAEQRPAGCAELDAERSAIEQRIAHLEAQVAELGACQQLQQRVLSFEQERRVLEGEAQRADEDAARARQRISDLRFSEQEYAGEKGAHDAAQRALEVVRLQRVRLEGEVRTKEALVERSRADLLKYDERRLEVERFRREVRVFDECDRILTDFRRFVNGSIRPRMAELASEYLADLTDGRYSAVELDEDFTPTVVEDGEPKRVISGGEQDILNLCMRIALSHMLAERAGQHFSLLMLDEVFGSLDEGRRMNVLSLLEKLRARFEQIIIISHLDDIKDGVQHQIQVEYDERTGSAQIRSGGDFAEEELGELVYNL